MVLYLVREEAVNELVFTGSVLLASEGAALSRVPKLSNTPEDDAMAMDREIADHFAAEREITFRLVGSANRADAITANSENRAPKFRDAGVQMGVRILYS